jgi:hypothetical protein
LSFFFIKTGGLPPNFKNKKMATKLHAMEAITSAIKGVVDAGYGSLPDRLAAAVQSLARVLGEDERRAGGGDGAAAAVAAAAASQHAAADAGLLTQRDAEALWEAACELWVRRFE